MNYKTDNTRRILTLLALFGVSAVAWAAGADLGQAQKQATNWTAIGMFGMFVASEAVRQLRGECGERQLPKAELALCHAPGLVFSCNTTMILGV